MGMKLTAVQKEMLRVIEGRYGIGKGFYPHNLMEVTKRPRRVLGSLEMMGFISSYYIQELNIRRYVLIRGANDGK